MTTEEDKIQNTESAAPNVIQDGIQAPVSEILRNSIEQEQVSAQVSPAEVLAEPKPIQQQPQIVYKIPPNFVQNLLVKARAKIQERKRKKLDRIMSVLTKKGKITNKDVQKLLRTTRRTTRRYFDQLEQEKKIKQVGSVGRGVFYEKIN